MIKFNDKIGVVYLAWLPFGISYFKDFIRSYINHPAGYDHKLIIAFNGLELEHTDKPEEYVQYIEDEQVGNVEFLYFSSGQDISIYKKSAALIDVDFFLFLNTYSRFENEHWLLYYINNWKNKAGLIGATGSYATYLSAIAERVKFEFKNKQPFFFKIKQFNYLLKIFFLYGRNFSAFPAPHIRTTGFFTSKIIFASIIHAPLKNKMRAYFFENGKNSMTAQVQTLGYRCIIIDRNGVGFDIPDWPGSKVFWDSNEENLLISDNQTRMYNNASEKEKKLYRKIAWNKN